MNIHNNARLTPRSRAELVRRVLALRQPPMSVATDMGVSVPTVRKWVARYRAEGEAGLADADLRHHVPDKLEVDVDRGHAAAARGTRHGHVRFSFLAEIDRGKIRPPATRLQEARVEQPPPLARHPSRVSHAPHDPILLLHPRLCSG